jgi:hypothetical protein
MQLYMFLIVFHFNLPFILLVCPPFICIYIEIKHPQQFIKYCKINCQLIMTINELFINELIIDSKVAYI